MVGVDHSHFTTQQLEGRHKFGAWQESISVLFDVSPPNTQGFIGFDAEVKSYMLGSMMLSKCRSGVQDFIRDSQTMARDGMDHIMLQYYLQGGNHIKVQDNVVKVQVGDIQILDMSQVLSTTTFGQEDLLNKQNFVNMTAIVARDRLEEILPCVEALHMRVLRASSPLNHILRTYFDKLYMSASGMTYANADMLVAPSVELLAGVFVQTPDVIDKTQDTLKEGALLAIRKFIDANICSPELGVGMIARYTGLSRASLYRLCQPFGGVMAMVRERRLIKARRLLSQTNAKPSVKQIAYSLGFSGSSNFSRAYRQRFGHAPMETWDVISSQANECLRVSNKISAIGDRKYEYWMRNLVA